MGSSDVSPGDTVLASQQNDLRDDVIDIITAADEIFVSITGTAGTFRTAVTQALATAGTSTVIAGWSPLRVKHAIAALGGTTVIQATQTAIEAETNEDTYAPPDLMRHNPGIAKVWCQWEQTGAHSIITEHNMTSVTDGTQAGDTDHVWDDDFSGNDYTIILAAEDNWTAATAKAAQVTTGAQTITRRLDGTNGLSDAETHLAAFGDQ